MKTTKEQMIAYISKNATVYNGKANLETIADQPDDVIAKTYRNIKTKVWRQGRTQEAVPQAQAIEQRIAAAQTIEECAELSQYLAQLFDQVTTKTADIRAQRAAEIKDQIAALKAELKEVTKE